MSEPQSPSGQAAPAVVDVRPRRARVVCCVLAGAVIVVFALVATALHGTTDSGNGSFQRGDQLAMIGLGVLLGLGILAFARPRVVADERHIKIRNVVGAYDLPWQVVRGIRFDRGSPWVSLELADDDVVAIMAIQAADKLHAVEAVRRLRALHQAATAPSEAPADGA